MYLNGQPVEIVDVENVLGRVANQESAANEKKYSAKAVNKSRKREDRVRANEKLVVQERIS